MTYLHPSWQLSATLASLCAVTALVLRLSDDGVLGRWTTSVRSFAREFAVVMALLGLWQLVGHVVRSRSAGAMHRAEQLDQLQHWLHLPDQIWFQQQFLPHHWLVSSLNLYYLFAHLNGMGVLLLWVWWRRRDDFRTVRNTVVATTLLCLLIQFVPVAPPRLLPGFVDTALTYGQSVYGQYQTGLAAQLTAMPSVHVAWAFIVAWYVGRLGRGPLRWLGAVHLVLTVVTITATANHWWLDGVAAIALALLVLAAQARLGGRPPAAGDPEPVQAAGPGLASTSAAASRSASGDSATDPIGSGSGRTPPPSAT